MYFLTKSLQYTQEIRYRIFFCFITLFTTFVISFIFREELLFLILQPLITLQPNDNIQQPNLLKLNLVFLNITEAFETYIYLSFCISLVFTLKMLVFQIFSFLAEAFYKNEKHYILFFLFLSYSLFLSLSTIIYYFLIPIIWNFFIYFQNNNLSAFQLEFVAQLSVYIHFFLNLILKLVLILMIPFVFGIIITILQINIYRIIKNRSIFIFSNLLIATLVSPPDIFSQIAIASILFILLECIFVYNFIHNKYK